MNVERPVSELSPELPPLAPERIDARVTELMGGDPTLHQYERDYAFVGPVQVERSHETMIYDIPENDDILTPVQQLLASQVRGWHTEPSMTRYRSTVNGHLLAERVIVHNEGIQFDILRGDHVGNLISIVLASKTGQEGKVTAVEVNCKEFYHVRDRLEMIAMINADPGMLDVDVQEDLAELFGLR